jgi:regulator of replication initiation timing
MRQNEKHMDMMAKEIERLKNILNEKIKESDILRTENYKLNQ